MYADDTRIIGEYCHVSREIKDRETYQKFWFTPISETEAEYLVKYFHPEADVIFYPDIRSEAIDYDGACYIRLCNNPMTAEDIEKGEVYPRLSLGAVVHEIAHLRAGVRWGHDLNFCNSLNEMIEKCKDGNYKKLAAAELERRTHKKKINRSISKIVANNCPTCSKPLEIKSSIELQDRFIHQLTCGHIQTVDKVKKDSPIEAFQSIRGEKLYEFQKENVEKFATANGRLCIFDEMGLGKTPSSIAISHVFNLFPVLVAVKSGLRHQWKKMFEYWGNEIDPELYISKVQAQVIENAKTLPIAAAQVYIVSFDLLPSLPANFFRKARTSNGKDIPLEIKLLIVDECQAIKNPESQRTRALFEVSKGIPNVVFTSGTPIKNSGIEFYPTLHLVAPHLFKTKAQFARDWVDTYNKGGFIKYGGIRNYEKFSKATERFIIRHTQAEVLPELPDITRNFVYTELDGESANKYRDLAREFKEYFYKTAKEDREFFQNILAFFVQMRHLAGLAKVDEAVDFAIDFLESTPRKLTIFTHHIDVREAIVKKLNQYLSDKGMKPCLELVGSMPGHLKEDLKMKFNYQPEYRILVASTLASGEGHNLQHDCSDCIMVERQWNPANEEQAEFRFKRPGQKSSVINATYLVALETIDEYFTKLVEDKRMMMKHALDGVKPNWNENEILMSLAAIIAAKAA